MPSLNSAQYKTYLLGAFAFSIPLSTAASSLLAGFIMIVWLFEGNFKEKFQIIINNRVALAVLAYISLHIVAIVWSSDPATGLHIIKKQWKLLLMPVLLTSISREHIGFCLHGFLGAMLLSVVVSFLVWFGLLYLPGVLPLDPTPFMDRVTYNPFLALAIFLLLHKLLFDNLKGYRFHGTLLLCFLMTINMFITQGRTGQLAFLVMIWLVTFKFFKSNFLKSMLVSLLILPLLLFTAYSISHNFQQRIDETGHNFKQYLEDPRETAETSIGQRLTLLVNSLEMIKENPLLGKGTGGFAMAYKEINHRNTPYMPYTDNPHNQYLLVTTQFGITGLLVFLSIFFFQFKESLKIKDEFSDLRVAFITLFLLIMFFDSYLLGHATTLLFSLFSAFLFCNAINNGKLKANTD